MADKHDVLTALKALASELGRTPTKTEFRNAGVVSEYQVERLFGSYTVAVQAAGLDAYQDRAKKVRITDAVFEKDIERHLEQYVPKEIPAKAAWPKIAILGDLHEPFGHDGVKADFVSFCERVKPEYIVQVGDQIDAYCHSKFPKSANVFTPIEEERAARRRLEELWSGLAKAAPEAKLISLSGNHSVRALKRVLESVPSIEHWAEKYLTDLLTFTGVQTIIDPREEHVIADIAFIHGYRSQLGAHRDFMLMNTVCGHSHRAGISFRQIHGRLLFEMNVGYAAQPDSKGFTYRSQRMTDWTLAYGYIDSDGPRVIPYR